MGKTAEYLLDKAFDALANEKRRSIITSLSLQPISISRLAELHALSLPAIYKHIRVLEAAELICRRKIGRSNFLVLNGESLVQVQYWLLKHQAHWGSAQATLENYDPSNFSRQPSVDSNNKNADG
jgi:DNA-binding transcriptional ArsR family regulator